MKRGCQNASVCHSEFISVSSATRRGKNLCLNSLLTKDPVRRTPSEKQDLNVSGSIELTERLGRTFRLT